MRITKDMLRTKYELFMKGILLFLLLFIPFRNVLEIFIGTYVKLIPDMAILLLVIFFPVLYKEKIRIKLYDICIGLFLVVVFVNTVFVQGIDLTIYIFEVRSIMVYYLLFFVIRNFEFSLRYKLLICKIIRYITYVLLVLGVIEKLSRKTLLFPKNIAESIIYEDNFARVYSMFFNPNTYGAFLVLSFFIVIYFEKSKLLLYKITVIVSLLLSMSRSSILLFAFFLTLYLIVIERKTILKNKKRLCGQALLIVCVSLLFYAACEYATDKISTAVQEKENELALNEEQNVEQNIETESNSEYIEESGTDKAVNEEYVADTSEAAEETVEEEQTTTVYDRMGELNTEEIIEQSRTDGRLFFLEKGLEIFKDYPILGTGFGTYGSAASMNWEPPLYEKYELPYGFYADNEYIKDLVETGIIGCIIFGAFLLSILYDYRNKHFVVLFCIGIGWFGLFYNVFEVQIVAYLLWLLLGMEGRKNEENRIRRTKKDTI